MTLRVYCKLVLEYQVHRTLLFLYYYKCAWHRLHRHCYLRNKLTILNGSMQFLDLIIFIIYHDNKTTLSTLIKLVLGRYWWFIHRLCVLAACLLLLFYFRGKTYLSIQNKVLTCSLYYRFINKYIFTKSETLILDKYILYILGSECQEISQILLQLHIRTWIIYSQ